MGRRASHDRDRITLKVFGKPYDRLTVTERSLRDWAVQLATRPNSQKRLKKRKLEVMKAAGHLPQCSRCGYNRSMRALEFHHPDGLDEQKRISFTGKLAIAVAEARQCVLLCCNCHREEHDKLPAFTWKYREARDPRVDAYLKELGVETPWQEFQGTAPVVRKKPRIDLGL